MRVLANVTTTGGRPRTHWSRPSRNAGMQMRAISDEASPFGALTVQSQIRGWLRQTELAFAEVSLLAPT
jgi:hypothetical protein